MKTLFKKSLCLIVTLCMVLSLTVVFTQAAEAADGKPTVFVIGDSTAERNVISSANAENRNGWGQVLYNYFKDTCTVWNWANSGESTRRLYRTWWKSIAGKISAGDYVLIQLGHNDGGREDVWTDPLAEEKAEKPDGEYVEGSYKWYLNYYVDTIRAKGAYPILVTSIERQEDAYLAESSSRLYNYVNAMKKVGQVEDVPVIDVWTDFRALYTPENADAFNSLFISDKIHINRNGAMATAKIFAENLKEATHEDAVRLAGYLVNDISSVTDKGVPTPQLSEDFNGAYTDGEAIGFPMNYWRLEASGTPIKNKTVKYSLQSGNDFAATFTSRKATADEITAYDYNDKVEGDPEKPGTPYTSKMENYLVRHTFEKPITEGYVKYSFRMKQNAGSDSIAMRIGGFSNDCHYIDLSDNRYLPLGSWHTFEFYLDIANKKLLRYADGKLLQANETATVTSLYNVWFGFARTIDANAEVTVDDISLTYIDAQTFNEKAGVLPENVYIRENFENGFNGDALSSALSSRWTYLPGNGNGGASYTAKYLQEKDNVVMLLANNDSTRQGLTYVENVLPAAITSGYVHIGWKMKSLSQTEGITCYFNPDGYVGTLAVTTTNFASGEWYDVDAYINISTQEFTMYCGTNELYKNKVISNFADGISKISFSINRQEKNYQIAYDDVIVETIPQEDYNAAVGIFPEEVLPENVLFSEKFNSIAIGSNFTSTAGGWSVEGSPAESSSSIKYARDPNNKINSVIAFNRGVQNLKASHNIKYSFADALTDGCYSIKFKIAPSDDDTKNFWMTVYGSSTTNTNSGAKTYATILFDFANDKIIVPGVKYVTNGSVKTDATIEYGFENDEWCNVELVFDLTAKDNKPAKVSLYLENEEKLTDLYFSNIGYSSFNDGTIKGLYFGFDTGAGASTLATPSTENPVCARVLLDDVVMEKLKNEAVSLVKTGDTLSGIKVNAGWKPVSSQKFLVAVYNTEDGEITTLKSTEIVTVSARGDNQEIALANPVSVEATDIVKVYFWDMKYLLPISTVFAKTIQ